MFRGITEAAWMVYEGVTAAIGRQRAPKDIWVIPPRTIVIRAEHGSGWLPSSGWCASMYKGEWLAPWEERGIAIRKKIAEACGMGMVPNVYVHCVKIDSGPSSGQWDYQERWLPPDNIKSREHRCVLKG